MGDQSPSRGYTDERPKKSAKSAHVDHWQGVGDPSYLLAEISELQAIAQRSGLGTLAYLLECAAIKAREQVRRKEEQEGRA